MSGDTLSLKEVADLSELTISTLATSPREYVLSLMIRKPKLADVKVRGSKLEHQLRTVVEELEAS